MMPALASQTKLQQQRDFSMCCCVCSTRYSQQPTCRSKTPMMRSCSLATTACAGAAGRAVLPTPMTWGQNGMPGPGCRLSSPAGSCARTWTPQPEPYSRTRCTSGWRWGLMRSMASRSHAKTYSCCRAILRATFATFDTISGPQNSRLSTCFGTTSKGSSADIQASKGPLMKAIRIHAFGGPEVVTYEDIPQPVPKAHEVLVKVTSTCVNYADVQWRL